MSLQPHSRLLCLQMARVEGNTEKILASMVAMEALQQSVKQSMHDIKENRKATGNLASLLGYSGKDSIQKAIQEDLNQPAHDRRSIGRAAG